GFGSFDDACTVAWFTIWAAWVGAVTSISTSAVAPAANDPTVHVTFAPPATHAGSSPVMVMPAGSVSTTTTSCAGPGPRLVTTRTYVIPSPTVTWVGPDFSSVRSAASGARVVSSVWAWAASFAATGSSWFPVTTAWFVMVV